MGKTIDVILTFEDSHDAKDIGDRFADVMAEFKEVCKKLSIRPRITMTPIDESISGKGRALGLGDEERVSVLYLHERDRARKLEQLLAAVKRRVAEQACDEALWAVDRELSGDLSPSEAYVRKRLRELHAVIEDA